MGDVKFRLRICEYIHVKLEECWGLMCIKTCLFWLRGLFVLVFIVCTVVPSKYSNLVESMSIAVISGF